MSRMARSTIALAGMAIALGGAGAGVATAVPTQRDASVPLAAPGRYLTDVKTALTGLQTFGTSLQSVNTFADFAAKLPGLRRSLASFDGSIRHLRDYRLVNGTLNRQRAGLARTGPPLAKDMSRFLDAVTRRDAPEVTRLVTVVLKETNGFVKAAQVTH